MCYKLKFYPKGIYVTIFTTSGCIKLDIQVITTACTTFKSVVESVKFAMEIFCYVVHELNAQCFKDVEIVFVTIMLSCVGREVMEPFHEGSSRAAVVRSVHVLGICVTYC